MRAFSGGAGLAFEETLRLFFGGGLPTLFFGGGLPTCSGLGVMGDYGRVMRMMTAVVIVLNTIMRKEWTEVMCWRGNDIGTNTENCVYLSSTMVLRESLECVLVVPGSKCAIVEILFLADVVDLPGQTLAPPHPALVDLVDLVDPPGQTLAPPHLALVGNGTV